MNYAPEIGIVSLGEAGNLGDDLILVAVIDAVYTAQPEARVAFLSSGLELDLASLVASRNWPSLPKRLQRRAELPFVRSNRRYYREADAVIFGGGGLLQTSHSPVVPYSWLSYLPRGRDRGGSLAVGLGLGPLSERWVKRLRSLGRPFDELWVRDQFSRTLAIDNLDWSADVCHDFISAEFVRSFIPGIFTRTDAKVLGVALRAWPGLDEVTMAQHIQRLALSHEAGMVRFFVLESNSGGGEDVEFCARVASRLEYPCEHIVYRGDQILDFMMSMRDVDIAISMKLHSSAIWAAFDVPMYPIYYAPKVASFFGMDFRGLEISDEIRTPAISTMPWPQASDVIVERLPGLLERGPGHAVGTFSSFARIGYQLRWLIWALATKVRRSSERVKRMWHSGTQN